MKKYINFATLILVLGLLVMAAYLASGFFTVTDNAFVVRIQTPVSAKVPGTVTAIHADNGEVVQKGQPLVELDDKAYRFAYAQAQAQVDAAAAAIDVLRQQVELAGYEVAAAKDNLWRCCATNSSKKAAARCAQRFLRLRSNVLSSRSMPNKTRYLRCKQIKNATGSR